MPTSDAGTGGTSSSGGSGGAETSTGGSSTATGGEPSTGGAASTGGSAGTGGAEPGAGGASTGGAFGTGGSGPGFDCAQSVVSKCNDGVKDPGEICYRPPVRIPYSDGAVASSRAFATGDLDGTGKNTAFVLGSSNQIHPFRAGQAIEALPPTDMCFQVSSSEVCPQVLVVGDVNGDQNADAVVTLGALGSRGIGSYLGDGSGTFATPPVVSSNPVGSTFRLLLVDVNNDGRDDVMVAAGDEARVGIADETGAFDFSSTSSFSIVSSTLSGFPLRMRDHAADLTGDGFPEVVGASDTAFTIALNDGTGSFDFVSRYGGPANLSPPRSADVNADDLTDLVFGAGRSVYIAHGSGFGGLIGPGTTIDVADSTVSVAFPVDVTNDGCIDIVAAHGGSGLLSVLPAVGGGDFGVFRTLPGVHGAVEALDMNGDGLVDFVASGESSDTTGIEVVLSNP